MGLGRLGPRVPPGSCKPDLWATILGVGAGAGSGAVRSARLGSNVVHHDVGRAESGDWVSGESRAWPRGLERRARAGAGPEDVVRLYSL